MLATPEHLRKLGATVVEVDRGGLATYHGPGQLVGYPILDLRPRDRDVHRYLRDLEQALIDTLQECAIPAQRIEKKTGVWVGDRKIASIGVRFSRWISSHGFALNATTDLSYFSHIVPCGMPTVTMTSVLHRRPTQPTWLGSARASRTTWRRSSRFGTWTTFHPRCATCLRQFKKIEWKRCGNCQGRRSSSATLPQSCAGCDFHRSRSWFDPAAGSGQAGSPRTESVLTNHEVGAHTPRTEFPYTPNGSPAHLERPFRLGMIVWSAVHCPIATCSQPACGVHLRSMQRFQRSQPSQIERSPLQPRHGLLR